MLIKSLARHIGCVLVLIIIIIIIIIIIMSACVKRKINGPQMRSLHRRAGTETFQFPRVTADKMHFTATVDIYLRYSTNDSFYCPMEV